MAFKHFAGAIADFHRMVRVAVAVGAESAEGRFVQKARVVWGAGVLEDVDCGAAAAAPDFDDGGGGGSESRRAWRERYGVLQRHGW